MQEEGPVQGEQRMTRTRKSIEFLRAFVGSTMKVGDSVVASDSKSKLWKDMSLKRVILFWNMKYVDVARTPGSALRVVHQQ